MGQTPTSIEVRTFGPQLITDPLIAYTGPGLDTNKASEVRAMLRPLTDMAQRYGVAILALRHLNKMPGGNASYRGQGSIDYFAISRSVLLVGKDPDDPSRSVMATSKSNLTPFGPSQAFRVITDDGARFLWEGQVETSVEQILGSPDDAGGPRAVKEAE